jgi:hypothetical protein
MVNGMDIFVNLLDIHMFYFEEFLVSFFILIRLFFLPSKFFKYVVYFRF